jgi:tetratricopeptide (TPR) repeat protein
MRRLLRALEGARRSSRRRGAAWVVAVCTALVATGLSIRRASTCSDGAATAWTPEVQRQSREAFEATGLVYAADAWARIDVSMMEYEQRWSGTWTAACATLDEDERDIALDCLRRSQVALQSTASVLVAADPATVEWSSHLLAAHDPPDACLDPRQQRMPIPPDEALAEAVARIRNEMTLVYALAWSHRTEAALERARAIRLDAETLGYVPLVAEAYAVLGEVYLARGDVATSAEHRRHALRLAEQSDHDRLRADVGSALVENLGELGRLEEARAMAETAAAIADRVGASDRDRGALSFRLGQVLLWAGDFDSALCARTEALEYWTRGNDPWRIEGHRGVASVLRVLGHTDEALEHQERAMALTVERFGPEHPRYALERAARGQILVTIPRLDEGLEDLAAATEGLARARGPEHRDVLDVRIAHAQALVAAERWKQAIRVADPCVTASLHRPEALRYHASCLQLMGTALHGGEGPGAALPVLEQALTAAEGLDRGDSLLAAAARFELARARIAQGRHDERTLDLVERALGVYRATSAFEDVTAQLETMLAQLRPPP